MNILLPIETINRELDFKVFLSGMLARQGLNIYVGQHDYLHELATKMYGGIYIGKNVFTKRSDEEDGERYYRLKDNGFDVVYLHEEGAVFWGREKQWRQSLKYRYDPSYFDDKDRICSWGEFQRQYDLTRCDGVPIHVTGHPRFDLYKKEFRGYYAADVEKIKSKYGRYVLINGNYPISNHGLGIEHFFSKVDGYAAHDASKRMENVGFYSYKARQMIAMVELTHFLSYLFKNINFVYRPHPSEDHDYYRTVFKNVDNIIVNHGGAVGPWILGAEAVIHDGCSTALEAFIAGVPVINYKPYVDATHDIWLPNQFGVKAHSLNEAVTALEGSIRKVTPDHKTGALLANLGKSSYESLVHIIEEKIKEKSGETSKRARINDIQYLYFKHVMRFNASKFFRVHSRSYYKYGVTKFPGFDAENLSGRVERVSGILNKAVQLTYHNKCFFEIGVK